MNSIKPLITTYLFLICHQLCFSQSLIDKQNIPWIAFRNLTSEQFSKKFKEYSKKGYLMIDVDGYIAFGKTRYSMVWQENTDRRGWTEHRDMSSKKYHEKWVEYKNKGYRPIDVEAYKKNGKIVYAGIWIQNKEGLNWSSKRNLTSSKYSTYFKDMSKKGFKVIDIEAYKIGKEVKYAAIWVENKENITWAQYRNMSRKSYQQKVNDFAAKGYIVVDYETYKVKGKRKYAAIWEKRPGIKYHLRTDRQIKGYANLVREYSDKGYRLIDFERLGHAYAGIWIQNDTDILNYTHKSALDNLISQYQSSKKLPGLSVSIIKDGKTLYKRGFGYADIKAKKKAWSGTVYLQASVSKVIGGTLAVKMASKGKLENGKKIDLDLDKKTATYLSNVKTSFGYTVSIPDKHQHTVKQLFSHLSCVRHYDGPEPKSFYYGKAIDALMQIWNTSLYPNCTLNSTRNYSTHAFTYAAAVLEEVSGQSTAQLITNEISKPYNLSTMRAMYAKKNLTVKYDRAQAYNTSNKKIKYEKNSWKILGGGIECSTNDLASFGSKVLNGKIVSANARDNLLWTRVNPNAPNGIAWNVSANANIVGHEGSANGARSLLRIYRSENLVIAINTNRDAESLGRLASDIANIIL